MSKEEFLENLKNWDGKYESLIPPTGLPDPADEAVFKEAFEERMYGSDFYRECVWPILEKAEYDYYHNNPIHLPWYCFSENGYKKYREVVDSIYRAEGKLSKDLIKEANLWVSVVNLYDIFKDNPEAAKLWGKHMREAEHEIGSKAVRDAVNRGETSVDVMIKDMFKAIDGAEPFAPNRVVWELEIYDKEIGKLIGDSFTSKEKEEKAETEAMTL